MEKPAIRSPRLRWVRIGGGAPLPPEHPNDVPQTDLARTRAPRGGDLIAEYLEMFDGAPDPPQPVVVEPHATSESHKLALALFAVPIRNQVG